MTRDDPNSRADAFWQSYLELLPESERQLTYFEAFQFGRGREMANQLSRLVLDGIKTATSDLIWHMEANNGKQPWQVGDHHVVFNGEWRPVCVIQTTELVIKPFGEVDEAFAYDYGEGDRTLAWWREHVYAWYAAECAEIGRDPSYEMPLLCERFRVVFAPSRAAMI
jgi:uncharacterized protein YhfF